MGFDAIFPISAISGYGTGDLLDEILKNLSNENKFIDKKALPRFAILGRPNVGKSTFLNSILNNKRTIVSDKPGTTRDIIDTNYNLYGKEFIITDTAGIRKKNKVNNNIEFYSIIRALKSINSCDVCFLIIDATKSLENQDINILNQIIEKKKGIIILVNKWDLLDKEDKDVKLYEQFIRKKIPQFKYIPIIFISALNKIRIHRAIESALKIYNERKKRVTTSNLNNTLLNIIENCPPSAIKGKYVKIKYITQLPVKYPIFAFFCNLPQYIKRNYKLFLENQIRKNFGFEGVPISIIFKKK